VIIKKISYYLFTPVVSGIIITKSHMTSILRGQESNIVIIAHELIRIAFLRQKRIILCIADKCRYADG